MKKFYLGTLIALSAMMLGSCSQNEDVEQKTDTANKQMYFSFAFGMANGSSARGYVGPEAGTTDECKVNKVTVILFDVTENVTWSKVFNSTDPEVGTPAYPLGTAVAGTAFQVPGSSTQMLLVVNPGTDFPSPITVGTSLATINAALATTPANLTNNGFEMANASGHLQNISANLEATTAAAEVNPAKIYVDRAVAKVKVTAEADLNSTNAWAEWLGWVLDVTNKSYFPMSTRVKTSANTTVFSDWEALGSYRVDPNYTVTENATYASAYDTYAEGTVIPAGDWKSKGVAMYCLENTQEAAANMEAYSTQALLKIKYTPKEVTDVKPEDGTTSTVTVAAGTDWISLGGIGYTWETLKNWIKYELTLRSQNATPGSYLTPKYDATKAFLAVVGSAIPDLTASATIVQAEADVTAVANALDAITSATIDTWAGTKIVSFNYYDGADNYYRVMIKHDDDPAHVNALGEFGVVRNNQYELTVKQVLKPGDPAIVQPKPDSPDEDDEKYLAVDIVINPWTAWTQDVNL